MKYTRLAFLSCYPGKSGRKLASELVLWQRNILLRYVFLRAGALSLLSSRATPRIKETGCLLVLAGVGRFTMPKVDFLWTSFLFVSVVLLFTPSRTMLLFNFFTLVLCVYLKGSLSWFTTGRLIELLWNLSVYLVLM